MGEFIDHYLELEQEALKEGGDKLIEIITRRLTENGFATSSASRIAHTIYIEATMSGVTITT